MKDSYSLKTDGFSAYWFEGSKHKDKAIIWMHGSGMNEKHCLADSKYLRDAGYSVLVLGFYFWKGMSKKMRAIPVEYVESAVTELKNNGYEKIGIDGTSKGSEMALIAASMFPELSCVIVRVPSHFVSEGLSGSGKNKAPSGTSCWSYQGKELSYAPYRTRSFNILKMFLREKEMHIITFNRDKDVTPETLIPIENIKAPVLMLSSTHDEVWPSYDSAEYMENKFNEIGFPYPHKHVAYKNMSHAAVTKLSWIYRMAFKSERRNPKECAEDREAMKKELLDWINNTWQ